MISDIKEWFNLAVPTPTDKNRAVQLGCHFEEVQEMRDAINSNTDADFLKKRCPGIAINDVDKTELLDALCDQIVTAIGVAYMFDMDISGALREVNSSNFSKFRNGKPEFDENEKIKKGPDFFKPDLRKFV